MKEIVFNTVYGQMVIPEDRVEIDFTFCRGDNNRIKSKWLTFYSTSYDTLIEFKSI